MTWAQLITSNLLSADERHDFAVWLEQNNYADDCAIDAALVEKWRNMNR